MKKNTIYKIGFVLIIIGILCAFFFFITKKNEKTDAIKFKESYESLNGTIRASDGAKYNDVTIPEKNPIQYVDAKKAVDIIQNKTGILYFGANWCPWCRSAVEVLFESAKEKDLDVIYYVDMDTVKNTWEIQKGTLVKTKEEKEGYYDLLKALDKVLGKDTYKLKDKEGNLYDTKEKRIYMPFVIAVKNGEIVDSHLSTVSLEEGQTKYDKLTETQHKELLDIYNRLLVSIQEGDSCSIGEVCS